MTHSLGFYFHFSRQTRGAHSCGVHLCTCVKMEWTIQKTIDLIELYRTSGVLWDPTDENYKNRDKRLDALRNISTTLEVPREEVERKIKNLVGQFSREIKKCKEKSSHGAADGTCESRWFAFKPLLFLKDKKKRLSSNSAIKV